MPRIGTARSGIAGIPAATPDASRPVDRPCTSPMKSSSDDPVASMILASDSVDGQRGRPSAANLLDLLNVVESRPARLASPEAERSCCAASASIAAHTRLWESMALPL
jgi:hypothetical protein